MSVINLLLDNKIPTGMTVIIYVSMGAVFHLLLTQGGFGRQEGETITGVSSLMLDLPALCWALITVMVPTLGWASITIMVPTLGWALVTIIVPTAAVGL